MSIQNLIASAGERLTPTERRIAGIIVDDPTLLAFGTVSDLALRVPTSRPTVVRFATKLGLAGYSHLQSIARDEIASRLSRPSDRIRRSPAEQSLPHGIIEDATRAAIEALDGDRLAALAEPIAAAERVWIVSGETSLAGAHAFYSGLSMIRSDVHLVQAQSTARALTSAGTRDVAIAIDFARYRRLSVTAARALADLGVRIIAITDGPLSPLAGLTDDRCELHVPAVGPFDSSVPAVIAAELIVSSVASRLGDAARDRIDRLESLWQTTDTFLDDPGGGSG
ncbi:MAG: MurR/RpiR family transcriptional regulator [Planctomycetota bacterium]